MFNYQFDDNILSGMKSGHLPKYELDEITGEKIPTRRFLYCQNKLCGVRNTMILGKYCSIMCVDCDEGVISEREWVELHYSFWVNSKVSYE